MRAHRLALSAALAAVLALAACSEEKSAEAPPAANGRTAEPAPAEKPALETAKEGLDKLKEAAQQAARDLQPTIDKAREGAQNLAEQGKQALDDAGPALERAGQVARQVGQSIEDIMKKARTDFDTAVSDLQKRIDAASGTDAPPTGDPAATLPASDRLKADTRAAARARPAGIGPAYVGVWAVDAAACAKVDVESLEMFAVITPTTIRRYESVCNFAAKEPTDGTATVDASCIAEGDAEERQISLTQADENRLSISTPGAEGSAELIRCHLPQ